MGIEKGRGEEDVTPVNLSREEASTADTQPAVEPHPVRFTPRIPLDSEQVRQVKSPVEDEADKVRPSDFEEYGKPRDPRILGISSTDVKAQLQRNELRRALERLKSDKNSS